MKRVKLVIAYDGSNYSGWQRQPNSITIEETLENAISVFLQEQVKIIGASRTDAGVHAYGQVAVFDTSTKIPAKAFQGALKPYLPSDIIIQSSEEVPLDFHPRYDCIAKTYEYRILNRENKLPMFQHITRFERKKLNVDKMNEAGKYLIGEHDFKSFASVHASAQTSIRRIYELEVVSEGEMIIIRVKGNGFLYNMVRIIAGTLIEVGLGKMAPLEVEKILEKCDRTLAGPTVIPNGLTLVNIDYPYQALME